MTPKQFNDAALQLFGSVYASAKPLGISLRQAQRYDAGDQVVAPPVANQLRYLLGHIATLKMRRRELLRDLEFFKYTTVRAEGGKEITAAWRRMLCDRLDNVEGSLRSPGEGMVAQI